MSASSLEGKQQRATSFIHAENCATLKGNPFLAVLEFLGTALGRPRVNVLVSPQDMGT